MGGPAPAVAQTRTAVRQTLEALTGTVLVGCSGGPDSLALAAATAFVGPRLGITVGAVVVDHQLQEGSAQIAQQAGAQCRQLGMSIVEVVTVTVAASANGGPEAAARTARHQALDEAAARHNASAVLLGHTRDDQAEQLFLGLSRGSGLQALTGIPPHRGLIRRPFLDLPRQTTEDACAEQNLTPWYDPTNLTGPGLRSAVRHQVIPLLRNVLGPGLQEALARTATQMRDLAELVDQQTTVLLAQSWADDGWDVQILAAAPTALRRAALHRIIVEAGAPGGAVQAAHVIAVDQLLTHWHGQGPLHLPGRLRVSRECGRLRLESGRTP